MRFEQHRVTNQGSQTAEVARAVEKVRVLGRSMAGMGKPLLQQRAGARDHEGRRTNQHQQRAQQPAEWIRFRRETSRELFGNSQGQRERCERKHA